MFFMLDSSDSDEEDKKKLSLQRRVIRQNSDIFNLPDSKFVECFRLSKSAYKLVLDKMEPLMKSGVRSTFIPNILKLATTLRFLAQGSYQSNVGNDFNLGLSQPTVSSILHETLDILETVVCPLFVKFEMTEEEQTVCKLKFFEKTGFPGVIGCIGGTHIKIIAPSKEEQNVYYNRKGFFSLNAMVICDHNMKIRFLDARYAGSCHDSLIWNMSTARQVLRARYDSGDTNCWLLGDAGYPLEPFLMTPYRSAQGGSPEAVYNGKHAKARNIVEKTIGVLKNRFRCLLGARQLHYKPTTATKIVNVCAALHNICIEYNNATDDFATTESTENYDNLDTTENLLNIEYNNATDDFATTESTENYDNLDTTENLLNSEASQIREQIKSSFL